MCCRGGQPLVRGARARALALSLSTARVHPSASTPAASRDISPTGCSTQCRSGTMSRTTLSSRASLAQPLKARTYSRMLRDGGGAARPNETTLSAVLSLPPPLGGDAAGLGFVRQVHSHAMQLALCSNAFVGSALVCAYVRCRNTDAITGVFEEITEPDAVCWNVMIDAGTQTGSVRRAVEVLSRMRMAGCGADGFTLASILKACSLQEDLMSLGMQQHACLWKKGRAVDAMSFYKEMVRAGEMENGYSFASLIAACCALASLEHGEIVHCRVIKSGFGVDTIVGNAVLDMYFKCGSSMDAQVVFDTTQGGLVDEGLEIFHSMVEDHNVNLGGEISREESKIMELELQKSLYVLLSNVYAKQRRWPEREMLRKRLDCNNIRKDVSRSWFPVSFFRKQIREALLEGVDEDQMINSVLTNASIARVCHRIEIMNL
ncbi:hypothetical protein ABZP36_021276 [Zizania latifolia]